MSGSNKKRVSCFTKSHHHDTKFGEEREAGLTKRVARIVRDSEEKNSKMVASPGSVTKPHSLLETTKWSYDD